jgi:gliding motility-associated-like protein
MLPCDSVNLKIQLTIVGNHVATPFTIKIQTHNGTYQHTIVNTPLTGASPVINEVVTGVTYGDTILVTIIDACGRRVSQRTTLSTFSILNGYTSVTDSCQLKYYSVFHLVGDSAHNVVNTFFPDPVTVVIRDSVTNAVVSTLVTNDTAHHSTQYVNSGAVLPGRAYIVQLTDGCGRVFTHNYDWPTTSVTIQKVKAAGSCTDSTASYQVRWINVFLSMPTFQLLSGPGTIGSSDAPFTYHGSISYPQSFVPQTLTGGYSIQLTNLGIGTYHYRISDTCGTTITDSFTILPQDVSHFFLNVSYARGCPGQNVIYVRGDPYSTHKLMNPLGVVTTLPAPSDTVINLNNGRYIVTTTYLHGTYSIPIDQAGTCQVIGDTFVIAAYQAPQILSFNQVKCHGSSYVSLLPDSTTGRPPYKYQVISGPQTVALQSSNILNLTQPGTYVARITDTCGFASTYTFTLDTLALAAIVKTGGSCPGGIATLSNPYSPYATYVWQRPSGASYTGDSLVINPVTSADYGIYHIKKIVNISGCRDSFSGTYTFSGNTLTNTTASVCPGQSLLFGGIPRSTAGVYYDTIHTTGCDSIVALTLSIRGPVNDSVTTTICAGRSVIVGAHSYTATGIYRDTFVTAGCDSIHYLNLTVTPYKRGSLSALICPAQTYLFGGTPLTLAGTYYDTLATSGCDSIVTLTLSVRGPLYDSISQTICAGHSVSSGIHTYTSTGIYRDTIRTSGCDSIHVFNLTVNPYKRDTQSAIICPGQSYVFGGVAHRIAGTYRDTIPTSGCDSIVTLYLSIRGPLYDSVSQTICAGSSAAAGIHSYTTTGIYRDTIATAGCDSIHVLNLTVTPYSRGSVSTMICPGQTVLFAGRTLSSAGNYNDTLHTTGCDSIVTLHLSIRGPLYDSVVQTICIGGSVSVGIHTYSTAGIYYDTIATAGCDSIHVLNLHVNPFKQGSESITICPGSSLTFGSQILSSAGTYYDTVHTTGCDSIITLALSIRGPLFDSTAQTICAGHSVSSGIHTYTATGIYRDTIATAGCDSIHVLNLTVNPYKRGAISAGICPGQNYVFGGRPRTIAGLYNDTIPTTGCDSIVTLTLSVGVNGYDSVVQSVCMGHTVTIGAHTYSATGIYRDTFTTAACDSFHVLNLIVSDYIRASQSANICPGQSFSAGTHSYTATGTYRDTLLTAGGCDSIITTQLTVITATPIVTTVSGVCTVTFNAVLYTSDTTLTDTVRSALGCDSLYLSTHIQIIPLLIHVINNAACIYAGQSYTVGSHTYTAAGNYADTIRTILGGCDSLIENTNLRVITPQHIHRRIDSCYTATVGGITYNRDTVVIDTILSVCGLDSLIAVDTLHFYDPSIQITASLQMPIIAGQPTQLIISPPGNYQNIIWSPDYEINNIYSASPKVSPYVDTTYYVTVENAEHCLVSAHILITVTGADLTDFLIPTAFSPDGNGVNDIYRPIIKPGASVEFLYFRIFDRWGQMIYDGDANGVGAGWDGTYKNVKQPLGVYIYTISAKVNSGQIVTQSGNVTLVR